jgi:hypothetical protein
MEIKSIPLIDASVTVSAAKPKKIVAVKMRPQSASERSLVKTVNEWNYAPFTKKVLLVRSENPTKKKRSLKTLLDPFLAKKD